MPSKEPDPREAICPRCGMDASWSYAGEGQTLVEVACPDCGRFELPRAEFDQVESEIAVQEDGE